MEDQPPPSSNNTGNNTATGSGGSSSSSTNGPGGNSSSNDPVLTRLKDLEDSNHTNAKLLDSLQKELREKDERIKSLSADKRKEMESILSTAIDKWLNSLAGVSDENKANFRQGICKLAERADMNNAAWEIVCHASTTHHNNVLKIEELLSKTQQQEQEIGDLKGFRNEASRISGHKRAREDTPALHQRDAQYSAGSNTNGAPPPTSSNTNPTHGHHNSSEGKNNTWDLFQSMISRDIGSGYY